MDILPHILWVHHLKCIRILYKWGQLYYFYQTQNFYDYFQKSQYIYLICNLFLLYIPYYYYSTKLEICQIIKFFVQILLSSDHLNESLDFIISLLQFLLSNLQACADCNLYIFILEFVENVKFQEKLINVVIQLILSLYSLLSTQHSTTHSVIRFISLFAPVK